MTVRVAIDRLVLDGIALHRSQRPALAAAVEAELARLIAAGGLPAEWAGAVPAVPAAALALPAHDHPELLGRRIAHAVYGGSES